MPSKTKFPCLTNDILNYKNLIAVLISITYLITCSLSKQAVLESFSQAIQLSLGLAN